SSFRVPQLISPGVIEQRDALPSFHYQPVASEAGDGLLKLPWQTENPAGVVGVYAREQGGKAPGRLIASAKSWLCHSGINRTADVLPWQGAADVDRLSPVQASARILQHIREAWDARFPDAPLAEQDIILTLPASFDEIARELTVEAAAEAGLARVVLLEEPQAAFYSWVYRHGEDWHQRVQAGQTILVCDIGGGTSDFTLIRVRADSSPADGERSGEDSSGGRVQFHRIAVGDHLILGGDNLDLALARHLERELSGGERLASHQWDVLVQSCRRVKEELLDAEAAEQLTVNLPGTGARLIGGGLQVEVRRDDVRRLLVDGFLPHVALDDKPMARQSGFQEFGLPYAADPAITKYLASFLRAHRFDEVDEVDVQDEQGPDAGLRPDVLLFNGGFFESPLLRERLVSCVASWYRRDAEDSWTPRLLDYGRLDLAVAHGAAYYGMVRRGEGVRIVANLARSYYIGVESDPPAAVCLVPGNAKPGQDIILEDRTFHLLISEPAEFPLWISSTRLTDKPGQLVPIDREQMTPLPPIRTVLKARSRRERGTLPVRLHARLNEIGTMDLWCTAVDRDRSWRLQFDVRSATQTDIEAHRSQSEAEGIADEQTWQGAYRLIADVFSPSGSARPAGLAKQLEAELQMRKKQWPTPLLRRIWETLMEFEAGRQKSAEHEARWVNLLGFSLRPGYGLAVDDWRVAETWRTVQGKLVHTNASVRNEAQVLWRRIAGGLSRGQQQSLADPLLASARNLHHRMTTGKTRGDDAALRPQELAETWRLLGSLELLDVPRKIELGSMLVDLLPKRKLRNVRGPMIWALGRLGQRMPLYGPLNTVVPRDTVEQWLEVLWKHAGDESVGAIAVMQLARRTNDRYRDVSPPCRSRALDWLDDHEAAEHLVELVREGGVLDASEQNEVFGESLPKGLRLE
ncbi:MAG: Hsp70 family protein, partial [Planctomycetota bacterium]